MRASGFAYFLWYGVKTIVMLYVCVVVCCARNMFCTAGYQVTYLLFCYLSCDNAQTSLQEQYFYIFKYFFNIGDTGRHLPGTGDPKPAVDAKNF